jgi:starch synthase (maltosyl-transferring)
MTTVCLDELQRRLAARLAVGGSPRHYRVPGLWVDPYGPSDEQAVVPEAFYLERLAAILAQPAETPIHDGAVPGEWSRYAVAYNLFVRSGAAWDHDGDGVLALAASASGWRETGTFLKAIVLLPFIKSLGCNTVHLLPITAVGRDGHKGTLGSPFAIRDPYMLEPALAEPALATGPVPAGFTSEADWQFAAFVEAAHHLGLRVVVEFVFRTAAKDAAWAGEHPEWFYWIREEVPDRLPGELREDTYGAPLFAVDELAAIMAQVGTGDFTNLLPPHPVYCNMFLPPPQPGDVAFVDGRWLGHTVDPATGETALARIPGAFSDWTPDSDQPPWTDVTYLRLYNHPDFNYIAYNTVRMYETSLARPEHAVEPLWARITEVIPYHQQTFGIDGVMIDMGHALPAPLKHRLIARARALDPDFALWAEDFRLSPQIRAEGYNVVVGPFMQAIREPGRFRQWLAELAATGVPVPFMATAENHNVPRAVTWPGGLVYSRYAATMAAFLPAIPYVHGGFELADGRPINTGFDFALAELAQLPAEVLPLFSAGAYAWTRTPNVVDALRRALAVRARYTQLVIDPRPESFHVTNAGNPLVLSLVHGQAGGPLLGLLANSDMLQPQPAHVLLPSHLMQITDLLTETQYPLAEDGSFNAVLAPGQMLVYRIGGSA